MNFRENSKFVGVLTFAAVFAEASVGKWIVGTTPDWFLNQFQGTILDMGGFSLPLAFWTIAVVETLVAVLLGISLVRLEYKRSRAPVLQVALILAQLVFVGLMIGQRLTHKYSDAALLFVYAILTYFFLNSVLTRQISLDS